MRSELEIENLDTDAVHEQMDRCAADVAQARESLDLMEIAVRRTQDQVSENQAQLGSHARWSRALWVIAILLVAGLGTLAWWGSPLLSGHKQLVAQMPVIYSTIDGVSDRIKSAEEEKIGGWANDRLDLTNRLDKAEKNIGAGLAAARNDARTLVLRTKQEIVQRLSDLESRVRGVESAQHGGQEEVARLQGELNAVRQEMAAMKEEMKTETTKQASQVDQLQQATQNNFSAIEGRLNTHQTAVAGLAHQIDRQRVDFELPLGRTQEIAKGIFVTVRRTNVDRQQVDGWLQIAQDGRILWLRGDTAQKPIEFAKQMDPRPYQLVFTGIDRDKTRGYILVPAGDQAGS